MSWQIGVVYEGPSDFEMATHLADCVIVESIPWMTPDDIDSQRVWLKESNAGLPFYWKWIGKSAVDAGVIISGQYDEEPGEPDAHAASRAILYLQLEFPELKAIMLIRDIDKQPLRRRGLEQARKKHGKNIQIVIGFAVLMHEAWVLSSFDPLDDEEHARLKAVRKQLGLDPRTRSYDVRDPKAALRALTAGDLDRARRCWVDASLPTLRERGGENGLADYLGDVRDRLVGLFGRPA